MSEQQNTPVVLELTVRNHPGVMTHVCGLFARRAFNLEGILCMPLTEGDKSRIWLLVLDDARLPQMISQVDKLEDVLEIKRHNEDVRVFEQVKVFFQ